MKRREFLKKSGIIGLGLALAPTFVLDSFAQNRNFYLGRFNELERKIRERLQKVKQEDKQEFGKDFQWYSEGRDNHSKSKIILIGDYHNESQEGFYKNLFTNMKKTFDSIGLEGSSYKDTDPLKSGYDIINKITKGEISFREYINSSELKKQIIKSGKPIYGIENKDLCDTHACAISIYDALGEMVKEGSEENLQGVLTYDKEIKRIEKLSPIALPKYDLQMFQNGKFDRYWTNLTNLITKDLIDARSVAAANNMVDYLKSEEVEQRKGIVTGFIYGAAHRDKFLERLNEKGISNIYIGSRKFEAGII